MFERLHHKHLRETRRDAPTGGARHCKHYLNSHSKK